MDPKQENLEFQFSAISLKKSFSTPDPALVFFTLTKKNYRFLKKDNISTFESLFGDADPQQSKQIMFLIKKMKQFNPRLAETGLRREEEKKSFSEKKK